MELQKLIDGLKAHRNGAASYESVDEAIRVFEAMRDVDGEKVVKELEELRNFADTDVHPVVSPDNWDVYADLCDLIDGLRDDALDLIRQQQERIAELEANRDATASKTPDFVGYLANLVTVTKCLHGDHVDIPLDVYAECIFRLNKYYKRCEEMEAAQTARVMTLDDAAKSDVCWLEIKDLDRVMPCRIRWYYNSYFIKLFEGAPERFAEAEYGTGLRCWTQRPTDEQRRNTSWE